MVPSTVVYVKEAVMPEIHYRDRFLQAELGPVVVRLARRVRGSVILTVAGRPLALDRVRDLEANTYALPEDDLQDFLKSVGEIGGYQGDSSYQSLSALFAVDADTSEDVPPTQDASDEVSDTSVAPSADAHEGATFPVPSDQVSEDMEPQDVTADVVQTGVTTPAKRTVAPEKRQSKAPLVHPNVPGLRLQSDGFYWNPKWGDV